VHIYVRPDYRARFIALFRHVLNCDVRELDFGLPHPIVLVSFGGSGFSVEFTDLATSEPAVVDDAHAFRGAWIEFRASDASKVHTALDNAGIPSFAHAGSKSRYFIAPGGQVFRVLDIDYVGP